MQKRLKHCTLITLSISALVLSSCFPTDPKTDNPTEQKDSDEIFNGSDPDDLPTDINESANVSESGIDSMFRLLIKRVENLENIETRDNFYSVDFASLRKGFGTAISKNPNHVKANIGFIVSSVLSLNETKNLQNLIDSMSNYINELDEYYYYPEEPILFKKNLNQQLNKSSNKSTRAPKPLTFLSKTFAKHGLLMTGQALVAQAPQVLLSQTKRPSFPRFLTMSFIQNTIENSIIPHLNEIIASTQRLRKISSMSLSVTINEETFEIDNSDISILEAAVRASRAGFSMLCIYDIDLQSPDGSPDMRWIDNMISALDTADIYYSEIYTFKNDTLFQTYYSDITPLTSPVCDVIRYNLNRSSFLSIRRNFHANVYSDLKLVPELIKSALISMKNETDNQNDDLFPATDILDISSEMAEFSADMIEEGFTPGLASKFQTPESLMDFISLLLSQPYTFNETIDGITVNIKFDLSKFFTNPAQRLTDYWPKYMIANGNNHYQTYTYNDYSIYFTNNIYTDIYDDTLILNIPKEIIKSGSIASGAIYLDKSYATIVSDSIRMCSPVIYVDDNGEAIDLRYFVNNGITTVSLQKFFPYYKDYTFGGIFPDMSNRQKWIDFFSNFIDD